MNKEITKAKADGLLGENIIAWDRNGIALCKGILSEDASGCGYVVQGLGYMDKWTWRFRLPEIGGMEKAPRVRKKRKKGGEPI